MNDIAFAIEHANRMRSICEMAFERREQAGDHVFAIQTHPDQAVRMAAYDQWNAACSFEKTARAVRAQFVAECGDNAVAAAAFSEIDFQRWQIWAKRHA